MLLMAQNERGMAGVFKQIRGLSCFNFQVRIAEMRVISPDTINHEMISQ